jgi:hypothetical protein
MGSISNMPIMQEAIDILKAFEIEIEVDGRTPRHTELLKKLADFSKCTHPWNFGSLCWCWWRGICQNGCLPVILHCQSLAFPINQAIL